MKKLMLFVMMFLMVMGCTRVNPGYTGIKVVYGGGDRGVQDFPIVTGWVGYLPFFSTVFEYPTFVQTTVWTKKLARGKQIQRGNFL